MLTALPRRQMSDHQEQMHEQLERIRVALHQMASEAQGPPCHTGGAVHPV